MKPTYQVKDTGDILVIQTTHTTPEQLEKILQQLKAIEPTKTLHRRQ